MGKEYENIRVRSHRAKHMHASVLGEAAKAGVAAPGESVLVLGAGAVSGRGVSAVHRPLHRIGNWTDPRQGIPPKRSCISWVSMPRAWTWIATLLHVGMKNLS